MITAQDKSNTVNREKKLEILLIVVLVLLVWICLALFFYFTDKNYDAKQNLKQARRAYKEAQYETALLYCEEAMQSDELYAKACVQAADVYYAEGKYEEAIAVLFSGATHPAVTEKDIDSIDEKIYEICKGVTEYYNETGEAELAFSFLQNTAEKTHNYEVLDLLKEINLIGAVPEETEENTTDSDTNHEDALDDEPLNNEPSDNDTAQEGSGDYTVEYSTDIIDRELKATLNVLYAKKDSQAYREKSDEYLKAGKNFEALKVIEEGIERTGDSALSERLDYLKENMWRVKGYRYEDGKLEIEEEFNREGYVLTSIAYRSDGSVFYENTYNDKGERLTYISYRDSGEIWSKNRYEYTFDENGKHLTRICYSEKDDSIEHLCEFDESDNIVKLFSYNTDGDVEEWQDYFYDAEGNLVKLLRYDAAGNNIYRTIYEYNEDGKLIKETGYYNGIELDEWTDYIYDKKGKLAIENKYQYNGKPWRTSVYTYASEYIYEGEMPQ